MSTAAQVRAAWETNVFQHSTVQALTTKIFDYSVETDGAKKKFAELREDTEINFITYTVIRYPDGGAIGARRYRYVVTVQINKQADTSSTAFNSAIDAGETIDARVIQGLGSSWSSTVDNGEVLSTEPVIEEVEIEGRRVARLTKTYTGIKYISD